MGARIAAFTFFLLLPVTAFGAEGTQIDSATANAYFENCVAKRDERMSEESQKTLCSCTAALMMKEMSTEDVRLMGENTPEGRKMLNHMLVSVYAPCMQYPIEDMISRECLRDEKLGEVTREKIDLCRCMGESTGYWFSRQAGPKMAKLFEINPDMTDPIDPVMNSPEFRRSSYQNMLNCLDAMTPNHQ